MKLTERRIKALQQTGRHTDDDCPTLTLVVGSGRGRSWVQRLMIGGRRVDRGLGSWPLVTLQDARLTALENRRKARGGVDPFTARREAAVTLRQAAERTLEANRTRWAANTVRGWLSPLDNHVFGRLGGRHVETITRQDVIETLRPIWTDKPAAANSALVRLRVVLDWALAHGLVTENLCANGGIKAALPSQSRNAGHHEAIPYRDVPEALQAVAVAKSAPALRACVRFIALTACRGAEARGARWAEIDTDAATWTIPGERMKSRREHIVPLPAAALAVLEERRGEHADLVFPSGRTGREFSATAILRCLCSAVGADATLHGFRSSFRDWAAEQTKADRAVVDLSLAHSVGTAVERAYFRTDLIEKRRELMAAWGAFVTQ